MAQHIAFLRAINVGGRRVKMEALAAYFLELGFTKVRTFIASGNVIFDSPLKPAALESCIEQHLLSKLGYEVETFVRSLAELREVTAKLEWQFASELAGGSQVYVGFMRELPAAANRKQVIALSNSVDVLSFGERELYWLGHQGMGESTVTGARLAKALGGPTTARNITSLRKLIATCAPLK